MTNNLKYIIYARKSQENRDRQALSIESQLTELKDFAKHNGLTVVQELEESQTAYKPGRPVFARMMELMKSGVANAVLVWKPDRIARNATDAGDFIQAIDDGIILELRTPYEKFAKDDERMMLYIHFGMSNSYSRQISANVKRGNRAKYARGEFCGRAPLGYLNAKVKDSRNIVLDPLKAPLLRRVFEEFSLGKYSVQGMIKEATDWGLTTVNGKKFAKSGMYALLSCPAYYGAYQHGGELHEGNYEPLISKSLFDKVQDVLRGRVKPRKQDWVHMYRSLVKCGGCGCAITAETKTKYYKGTDRHASYTYYRCTRRRGRCLEQGLNEADMEAAIRENIDKLEIDEQVWSLGIELLKAKNADELVANANIRKEMEQERAEVEERMEKLLALRMDGEISADEYAEEKGKLLNKKISLSEKLSERDQHPTHWLELAEDFFNTAYLVRRIMEYGKPEEKRDLAHKVGWNLILKDRKLQFSFKEPYDLLLRPHVREDVQGWMESDHH